MDLKLVKSEQDVRKWIAPLKLSYSEVSKKFGIDIEQDKRNTFFWNMTLNKKILVNDDLLSWCGYSGKYKHMKNNFLALLKKNPQFEYNEIEDSECRKKRYIVMDTMDFESMLMQMRSRKAHEIRELYSVLRHISTQYTKYEKYYEEHRNEMLSLQNNQLTQSVHELKDLVWQVKSNADKEIEKAEQERQKAEKRHLVVEQERQRAEQERQMAEQERQKAEKRHLVVEQERQKAEQERQMAEKRHTTVSVKLDTIRKRIRTEIVDCLRTEIAPLVAPQPIHRDKERCLGLICITPRHEWYIIRRQRESFNKAINAVLRKNPSAELVKQWCPLAHSVDIGNCVKLRLRNLKWLARGNILKCENAALPDYSNDELVKTINAILDDNSALKLSDQAETMITSSP